MLHVASGCGQSTIVDYLLKNGAKPNQIDLVNFFKILFVYYIKGFFLNKRTSLHYAVQFGDDECVNMLIDAGANVKAEDASRFTALHLAANRGDLSKCRILLDHGAKIDVIDDTGATPLHWAVTVQNQEVVEFLLSRGARNDLQDSIGRTPLHIAYYFENRPIIQVLLDNRADLSITDVCLIYNFRIWVESLMNA